MKPNCRIGKVRLKDSGLTVIIPNFENPLMSYLKEDIEQHEEMGPISGYALIVLRRDEDCLTYETDLPDHIFWDRVRGLVDPTRSEEMAP